MIRIWWRRHCWKRHWPDGGGTGLADKVLSDNALVEKALLNEVLAEI